MTPQEIRSKFAALPDNLEQADEQTLQLFVEFVAQVAEIDESLVIIAETLRSKT